MICCLCATLRDHIALLTTGFLYRMLFCCELSIVVGLFAAFSLAVLVVCLWPVLIVVANSMWSFAFYGDGDNKLSFFVYSAMYNKWQLFQNSYCNDELFKMCSECLYSTLTPLFNSGGSLSPIGVRAWSTLGARHFCPKNRSEKLILHDFARKMPEFYIIARKIFSPDFPSFLHLCSLLTKLEAGCGCAKQSASDTGVS